MNLSDGMRLGPYEILAPLGAGGMGEVYRARDTRLERTVAIKILPRHLSSDPVRKQRLEREAKIISGLNHPHICVLYDVGHQDGIDYLVMEYLEGETLAKRLEKGPLPLEQVAKYGAQIADALDKAHHHDVAHRDLKPGNIMLTPTGAKLLDFGLAKPVTPPATMATLTAAAPTSPLTEQGTIVGTFQYMAPEQLEGKELDARSDIFSLGAVLYEMVTGQHAFQGKSQLSVASAILEKEPAPISTIKPLTPPALDHAIRRCLAKDPEERWQAARDLAQELKWVTEVSSQAGDVTPPLARVKSRERLAWIAAGVFLLVALVSLPFTIGYRRQIPLDARVVKLSLSLPEKTSLGSFAISPDGRWLAFTAATSGNDQLWVRGLDALTAQVMPSTEGAGDPFWSPDSRSIGFFAGGKLKKIGVSGGSVQTVCDVSGAGYGGTWSRGGVIVFATSLGLGLNRVSATGGVATPMTAHSIQEFHWFPSFLPDGRHFLDCVRNTPKETRGIYLSLLDGTVKQRLLGDSSNALYAPSLSAAMPAGWQEKQEGYLLFLREGALLAQPFDDRELRLSGEPFAIAERVGRDPRSLRGSFSVSDNRVLVYDSSLNRQSRQLLWVDRQGKLIRSLGARGGFSQPRLSPDEKRVVVDPLDSQTDNQDVWLYDVTGGAASRFTFDPAMDRSPVWSPDGSRIIWRSNRDGTSDLYSKAASGAGSDEVLLRSSNMKIPSDWSLDGRFLIYYEIDPKTKRDIWVLPMFGDRKPFPFLRTEWSEAAGQLSPDGRWMAYASDQTGAFEVYVRSFPSGVGPWQVSTKGGTGPCWRRDGKELFYYAPDGKLMAAEVKSEVSFGTDVPHPLFEFRSGSLIPNTPYSVTADGQRFLVNSLVDESGGAPLTVWVNWQAELKR